MKLRLKAIAALAVQLFLFACFALVWFMAFTVAFVSALCRPAHNIGSREAWLRKMELLTAPGRWFVARDAADAQRVGRSPVQPAPQVKSAV
jgi:hypothetical protein